ncbi:MAG: FixH family protein [Acidobacteriota bacterium]
MIPRSLSLIPPTTTTGGGQRGLWLLTLAVSLALTSCTTPQRIATGAEAGEAIARTEFTGRIENFFEYEPLKSGKPSQFRIHLTDLSDGSPVEQAEVTLTIRAQATGSPATQMKARVGKVIGIYVADVTIPQHGTYDIEFHIKNNKLDERLPLTEFKVE